MEQKLELRLKEIAMVVPDKLMVKLELI